MKYKVMFWLTVILAAGAGVYNYLQHPTIDHLISWCCSLVGALLAFALCVLSNLKK